MSQFSVGRTTSAQASAAQPKVLSATEAAGKGYGKDDFLKLLVAQLQNQDPMNPTQDREFLGQMAQFRALEEMQSLNTSMSALFDMQQLGQASQLIGKTVEATTNNGEKVSGKVSEARIEKGIAILQVGDWAVPLHLVEKVTE